MFYRDKKLARAAMLGSGLVVFGFLAWPLLFGLVYYGLDPA